MADRSYDILLAEDDPAAVTLMNAAWADVAAPAVIHEVRTGSAVLDFLHKRGEYTDAPTPELLLLDLNLEGSDGLDVLADLRAGDRRSSLPVIVFSGSEYGPTVEAAYEAGANAFVTKPDDYAGMLTVVESIRDFWFSVAEPPKGDSSVS